jgi:ribosomal protein S18 acetylase RimI-like enzyme
VTVALRPLDDGELEAYLEHAVENYARQMIEFGGVPEDAAWAKSHRDNERLLTSGAAFYAVEDEGQQVGWLVLGERERNGAQVAFVYDVTVDPERRGEGIGRQAMDLAEQEARAQGHDRIELNVFGGNDVARSLYDSLGYRETSVTMAKDLS